MKKRRHHYVWKHYLKPWLSEGKVWCLRGEEIFETAPINIVQERDFYKLHQLSNEEISYLKLFAGIYSSEPQNEANLDLVIFFEKLQQYQLLIESFEDTSESELQKVLDNIFNSIENYHEVIESIGHKYLDKILKKDISFYFFSEHYIEFIMFLCHQYIRTKNHRERMKSSQISHLDHTVNFDKMWSILSIIVGNNIGISLFKKRDTYKLNLLENQTAIPFITTDQPVINTQMEFTEEETELVGEVELFYPVSPNLAILVSSLQTIVNQHKALEEHEVLSYNKLLIDGSLNQIFSNNEDYLNTLIK